MRKVNIVTFLFLLAAIPLAICLPKWAFWENHWVENMQAVVLLGACLFNFVWAIKSEDSISYLKSIYISEAILFLVAFGREISWGRIFYPVGMGSEGPEFLSIKEVWFGPYLPWVLGLAGLILLYNLWRSRTLIRSIFSQYKSDHTIRLYLVLFILGLVLSETVFEKNLITPLEPYHQGFEEVFELIAYWSAFAISYRLKQLFMHFHR